MNKQFRNFLPTFLRSLPEFLLLLCWSAGLIFGVIASMHADETYLFLMRRAVQSPVSIVGLVSSVYLPFLLSAFAVYIGKPGLLYIICFGKAFVFAFAAYGATSAFGSAGWLVRILLQFSDILLLWLLCWFALRHIRQKAPTFRRDLGICTAAAIAVCSIDYCVISPFLAMVTEG